MISQLESVFHTKSLVLKSFFAAPDSKNHKPLTNSRPGVGAAWVLNKRIPVQKDFARVAVPLLQRVGGWGARGPRARQALRARQQGEASTRRGREVDWIKGCREGWEAKEPAPQSLSGPSLFSDV